MIERNGEFSGGGYLSGVLQSKSRMVRDKFVELLTRRAKVMID